MGKFRYASPEHFSGPDSIEPRSDVYSFGVVLYELLTRKTPFVGTQSELMAGHVLHPPRSFDATDPEGKVPEDVRALILKALEKRPEDRFDTAADFAAALTERRRVVERERSESTEVFPRATGTTTVSSAVPLSGTKRLAPLERCAAGTRGRPTISSLPIRLAFSRGRRSAS